MIDVKNRYLIAALLFAFIFVSGRIAQAQTLGSLHLSEGPSPENELVVEKGMALEQALKHVEKQFNVVFLYRTDALENKKVANTLSLSSNVTEVLTELLTGQRLEFKYLNPKTYGIFASAKLPEKKEAAPLDLIRGTVTDGQTGETLPGVNIMVKGTTIGTSTDQNGNYELDVPSYQDTLVVSFVGYQSREEPINGRQELNIALQPQAIAGEELVVVGYGTQQKSSLTGSVAKVENEDLDQIPVGSVGEALAGRLAGVNIVNSRNRPGQSPRIQIRGIGSIDGGNDPLIVIDGFPGGDLDHINMNNVESIEVLKDASAAAIYGSRGAGGVILVTTKSGSGEPTVELDFSYGISSPMLHDDWLTGEEWYE
ncbi:MAG TPA: carboxypeptidase-like regulatory domain-containing protein, partial [Fodinibius sp.]|nr:carboxypeptidase-like regulatory domain-containing protein [Fodinibius sp.]